MLRSDNKIRLKMDFNPFFTHKIMPYLSIKFFYNGFYKKKKLTLKLIFFSLIMLRFVLKIH